MQTYYLVSLFGGLFNGAYKVQAADYDSMVQKSLAYFREFHSRFGITFDVCMFGNSVYFLNDGTWVIDKDSDYPSDRFEIIVFTSENITEIE